MKRLLTGVLILAGLLLNAAPVLANSAPPFRPGDRSGIVLAGSTGQVHVLGEELRFDVVEGPERHYTADVTVQYRMENRGPALPGFEVVFVTKGAGRAGDEKLKATWDGKPLKVDLVDTSRYTPQEQEAVRTSWTAMETLIDPTTQERYTFEGWGAERTEPALNRFVLDLPAGAAGTLEVKYRHTPTVDMRRLVHPVSQFQYLLLPARGWASFGPVAIRVRVPESGRDYFASTIPLRYEAGEYRADLPGLPAENLVFAVMSDAGLFLGTAQTGPYYWLTFVLVLAVAVVAGMGIGVLFAPMRSAGWGLFLCLVAGAFAGGIANLAAAFLANMSLPALQDHSYGSAFIAAGQAVVATVVSIMAAGMTFKRQRRKVAV